MAMPAWSAQSTTVEDYAMALRLLDGGRPHHINSDDHLAHATTK